MWKLRIGAVLTSGLVALSLSATALAGSSGPNAGDVWVDNVGQPAGPGHEMDPHLACQDINLWGSGLTDASGSFKIDGWAPSGSQDEDYSGTWNYVPSGDQVMAVIDVSKLMQQAEANGDTRAARGFHFKLQFTQNPQKHKTFWLDCTRSSAGGTDGGGSNGGGETNSGGDNNTPSSTTTPGSTTTPATTSSMAAVATSHRIHHRRHERKHDKTPRKIRRHRVRAVRIRLPSFTA